MKHGAILIVEDNPTTRRLVRFALEGKGHRVLEAPDGRTALQYMQEYRPVLVLQDLVLPDIDGFALVEQLRSSPGGSEVSILALSGFGVELEEARISAVGFDDIVTKPIEPARLLPIVEAYLPTIAPPPDRFGMGRRLVLADDDPVQLKLAAFRLTRAGFEVEHVSNGESALRSARASTPSAIVADVMMPGLDGFGLTLAIRNDPSLAGVPVVLVTSTYVEAPDRELALRAGAADLVPRTPDLRELMDSLRTTLELGLPSPHASPPSLSELESVHSVRVVRQLERQVLHNTGLARRCSALAAELLVLSGLSETVLQHRNLEAALDEAVSACFDAGGVDLGALYLYDAGGAVRVRPIGGDSPAIREVQAAFFGQSGLVRRIEGARGPTFLSTADLADIDALNVLGQSAAKRLLVIPLVHRDAQLGALVMATRAQELDLDDWVIFAQGVGNQISQTIALASAFAQREAAEREALEQKRIAHEHANMLRRVQSDVLAVAERLGLAEVADAHRRVLLSTSRFGATSVAPPEEFFADVLAPFEAAFRSCAEANDRLVNLNDMLAERNLELVRAKASTEASNRELEAFSYSVSHDLRAPLRSIDGFSQALEEDCASRLDPQGVEYLQSIRRAAGSMAQLIEALLGLALVTRSDVDRTQVDLTDIARRVCERLQAGDPHRETTFIIEDGVKVDGDARLLAVVLDNLLGNAWKFTAKRPKATIEFGQRREGKRAVYFVRDDGAGFDMTYADRLFGAFQRLHSSADFAGTGIGLATVQRIVRRHGGRVWAEGNVDRGAVFSFTLSGEDLVG